MKRFNVLAGTTLAVALALTSCGPKGLTPEQITEKAKTQFDSLVTATLQAEVDMYCASKSDTVAIAAAATEMAAKAADTTAAAAPATETPAETPAADTTATAAATEMTDDAKIAAEVAKMVEEFKMSKMKECDDMFTAAVAAKVEAMKAATTTAAAAPAKK